MIGKVGKHVVILVLFCFVLSASCRRESEAETLDDVSPAVRPADPPEMLKEDPPEEPVAEPPTQKSPEAVTPPAVPDPVPADRAAADPVPDTPPSPHPALLTPDRARDQAPDDFRVRFNTSQGEIVLEVRREWAPRGVDRFYNLVRIGYFNDVAFFRVIDGFVAQFGIHGDPKVNSHWREERIPDDPVRQTNTRGTLTFATAGPNTRTTQMFFNMADNPRLDEMGFSPVARVVEGIEVLDNLYSDYGEGAPRGGGPTQPRIEREGNAYLKESFPRLDYLVTAHVE